MDALERLAVTQTLARFIGRQSWTDIPDEASNEAKRAIADCIGGAIDALHEPQTQITLDMLRAEKGQSSIWGAGCTTTARNAALVNGTMAHAHDFDDTNESMRGHPSAPVVPAIFALAPEVEADGKALIVAYLVGVEVEAKLGRSSSGSDPPSLPSSRGGLWARVQYDVYDGCDFHPLDLLHFFVTDQNLDA